MSASPAGKAVRFVLVVRVSHLKKFGPRFYGNLSHLSRAIQPRFHLAVFAFFDAQAASELFRHETPPTKFGPRRTPKEWRDSEGFYCCPYHGDPYAETRYPYVSR